MAPIEISIPHGVPLKDLWHISEGFVGLYAEVSKTLTGSEVAEWRLTGHHSGSLVLEASPVLEEDADPAAVTNVTDAMMDGLIELSEGRSPAIFSNRALHHATSLVSEFTTESSSTRIQAGHRLVNITSEFLTTARTILNRTDIKWGTVEGHLQSVSLRGRRSFNLYEILTDERVACRFRDSQLPHIKDALGRRVVVSGEIHTRGDSIDYVSVERFHVRPPSSALPSFSDIRGLLKD